MAEISSIGEIIAAINPDKYTSQKENVGFVNKSGFKKALKADFWNAITEMGNYNLKPKSLAENKLVYESSSETLEPVYFWTLDIMNQQAGKVEKLVDTFVSSPGSGHFSELMGKSTRMQEEANKIMQTNGILIKSIINIIYDLKEFEIRLSQYKSAHSPEKEKAEAGWLALKQIWMDNVDIKRGQGSINALSSGNLQFVTLRDAFMATRLLKDVDEIDLNDRVKRILKPRLQEFFKWAELSETELQKRYEIEKVYLKNQVNSLKLNTRWAKPYLRAAMQLEQKESGRQPALVTAFNTILLELTLLGRKEVDFANEVANKRLPEFFRDKALKRKYYSCLLVDFYFRGIPQKVGQHYVFGGKVEVTFKAYALNEDEIKMLNKKLDESDLNDALGIAKAMTDESLVELQEDIDYFLKKEEERTKKEEETGEDTNPFAALFGLAKPRAKKDDKKKIEEIKPDSYMEEQVRKLAENSAKDISFRIFDIYKKAHGMASYT